MVAEHDAVVFMLARGVAVIPMLHCRQTGELILGFVVVADIFLQPDIRCRFVGPLQACRGPFRAGDLVRIRIIGRRCAGHHVQCHGCGGDGCPGGDGLSPAPAHRWDSLSGIFQNCNQSCIVLHR